jgi:hypothetical protein
VFLMNFTGKPVRIAGKKTVTLPAYGVKVIEQAARK